MADKAIVLGYDVGGTKIGIGLCSSDGKILGKHRVENKDSDPNEILPLLVKHGQEIVAEHGLKMSDVRGFGISSPGAADVKNGIMTRPTNNPKWHNVRILEYLQNNLKLEGCFENDANCAALAEWFFGAGRGVSDFVFLTQSTGVGGGIVTGNTLVRGTGFFGGEVGHMVLDTNSTRKCGCGMFGCYEAFCGGRAIAHHLQEVLKDQPHHPIVKFAGGKIEDIDMLSLEKAVRAGDKLALQIWDEMSLRNAQAMGILMNSLNPKRIILGTLAWAVGDLYTNPIKKYLPRFAWKETLQDCELVCSELKRDMGYYAGAAAALYFICGKRSE